MKQEMRKRIVSKGEYVKVQGQRGVIAIVAVVFWAATLGLLLITLFCLFAALSSLFGSGTAKLPEILICLVGTFLAGRATFYVGRLAKDITKSTQEINDVLPLTRANTGHLPAPDSLVRASEEPVQEQQSILLRAATESEQTPLEQLVRPSRGTE